MFWQHLVGNSLNLSPNKIYYIIVFFYFSFGMKSIDLSYKIYEIRLCRNFKISTPPFWDAMVQLLEWKQTVHKVGGSNDANSKGSCSNHQET